MTFGCWQNVPGATIAVEVQKVTGAWVNVTPDLLPNYTDFEIQMAGRQTELDRSEPGALVLALDNSAGTYTPGLPSAPVMLAQGMPIRVRESIGRQTTMLFTGELQQPELVCDVPGNDRVRVSAIDWLGGQDDGGRTFISTLAEWIRYHAGDTLQMYYPMTDPAPPMRDLSSHGRDGLVRGDFGPAIIEDLIRYQDTVFPSPGELGVIRKSALPYPTGGFITGDAYLYAILTNPLVLSTGQYLIVSFWARLDARDGVTDPNSLQVPVSINSATGLLPLLRVMRDYTSQVPTWTVEWGSAAWNDRLKGPIVAAGRDYFVTARVQFGALQELWVNGEAFSKSFAGSPPSSTTFTGITVAQYVSGLVGHVQVQLTSDVNAYTLADHTAQYRHGIDPVTAGLAWQRTDERIATLAAYAGLSPGQLALDRGTSWMPAASLAGRTFSSVSADAVDTEQGRLFVAGDGHLTFHNRTRTLYNH